MSRVNDLDRYSDMIQHLAMWRLPIRSGFEYPVPVSGSGSGFRVRSLSYGRMFGQESGKVVNSVEPTEVNQWRHILEAEPVFADQVNLFVENGPLEQKEVDMLASHIFSFLNVSMCGLAWQYDKLWWDKTWLATMLWRDITPDFNKVIGSNTAASYS